MPRIELTNEHLHLHLGWAERLLALHAPLRIPLRHVRGATDDDGYRHHLGLRVFGSSIPGLFRAGWYRKGGDSQFVYATARQHLVVIELAEEKWARLVLGVKDPRQVANAINAAVARRRAQQG